MWSRPNNAQMFIWNEYEIGSHQWHTLQKTHAGEHNGYGPLSLVIIWHWASVYAYQQNYNDVEAAEYLNSRFWARGQGHALAGANHLWDDKCAWLGSCRQSAKSSNRRLRFCTQVTTMWWYQLLRVRAVQGMMDARSGRSGWTPSHPCLIMIITEPCKRRTGIGPLFRVMLSCSSIMLFRLISHMFSDSLSSDWWMRRRITRFCVTEKSPPNSHHRRRVLHFLETLLLYANYPWQMFARHRT